MNKRGLCRLMTLLAALAIISPAVAQKKSKKPKPKRLAPAVAKANKLLGYMEELDRDRIKDAGYLRGVFRFSVTINRTVGDDGLVIEAVLRVDRGKPDRYKRQDERDALVRLANGVTSLKREKTEKIREVNAKLLAERRRIDEWNRNKPRGTRPANVDRGPFKEQVRKITREYDAKIKQEQRHLSSFARPINERLASEKEKHDAVAVTIFVSKKLAARIDMKKFAERKKASFVGRVESYEATPEAEEAGGKLRVSELTIEATGIHDSIRKKKAQRP